MLDIVVLLVVLATAKEKEGSFDRQSRQMSQSFSGENSSFDLRMGV